MQDKLRVGIIGLGRMGIQFEFDKLRTKPASHWGAFSNCDHTTVVAGCDVDKAKRDLAREHIPSVYDSVERMMKSEDLNIVTIATPVDDHYKSFRIILDYWDSNIMKGILLEKPMSRSLAQARDMAAMAKGRGIVLAVNLTRRWDLNIMNVFNIVNSGELGEILAFHGRYSGDVLNDGIHMIDLHNWFKTAKTWTQRTTARVTQIPSRFLLFEFDILTVNGRIIFKENGANIQVFEAKESSQYTGYSELVEKPFTRSDLSPLLTMVFDFANCVIGAGESREPKCGGKEGCDALRETLRVIRRIRSQNP